MGKHRLSHRATQREAVSRIGGKVVQVRHSGFVIFLIISTASLLLAGWAEAQWSFYEETSIVGTISGSIRKGHIFKTRSGHIYEVVDYVYLYKYEYSPEVVVLSDGNLFKLIIEGFDEPLVCKCLNCSQAGTDSFSDKLQSDELTIKAVQAALAALGFDPGTADGTLSPQTRLAVKKFRVVAGLTAIDNLDATTLRSIAVALTQKYPDDSEVLTIAVYLLQALGNWPQSLHGQKAPGPGTSTVEVIESYVINDFGGLNYGNIYKLANGQIWEQIEYWTWVWVWVSPRVRVWNDGGIYRMKVEGIDHPIMVRRIK